MFSDGKRLEAWRESLPRGPIAARSLSVALGWEESRWWNLERIDRWKARQADELRIGLDQVLDRLDVDDAARAAAIAYVLEGGEFPPPPARWRDGMCPSQPVGRKKGTRVRNGIAVLPRDDSDDPRDPDPSSPQAARPIIPEALNRTLVATILRSLTDGEVSEEEAVVAIARVYEPTRGKNYFRECEDGTAA